MIRKPETVKVALMMSARAAVKREIATSMDERGDYHASWELAEADEMDEAAGKFLDVGSHERKHNEAIDGAFSASRHPSSMTSLFSR